MDLEATITMAKHGIIWTPFGLWMWLETQQRWDFVPSVFSAEGNPK